jgi:hypothetical protein
VARAQSRRRPLFESLEERRALSVSAVTATETIATLDAFAKAYGSHIGQPHYNPAFDLNHNGQIGQEDGRLLLRALPPLGPNVPVNMRLMIAAADKAKGHVPTNLGGVTHSMDPTVLGHTVPGALVFTGMGTVDLKLKGPVVVADANGNFSIKVKQTDGINQLDFLAVDHYGQQDLRAFPILWLGFSQFEAAHPKKT